MGENIRAEIKSEIKAKVKAKVKAEIMTEIMTDVKMEIKADIRKELEEDLEARTKDLSERLDFAQKRFETTNRLCRDLKDRVAILDAERKRPLGHLPLC